MKCAVIGAGSWGTALGHHLARCGHEVILFAHEAQVADGINREQRNPLYLDDFLLEPMTATTEYARLFQPFDFYLWTVPTQVSRGLLEKVRDDIDISVPVVIASKGIENTTLLTLDEVFRDSLGPHASLAVLSGPSFAREVVLGFPTAVTIACKSEHTAQFLQSAFASPVFRAYTTRDVVGVEICGAVKNVIAIASGICSGLGLGHNTTAALLTRGLAEITRLVVRMGGEEHTTAGLAGMGDLTLTCTGSLSRNRTVGERLARGESLDTIISSMKMVAEGIETTRSTYGLAQKMEVEMPITTEVYRILFEGKSITAGIRDLMERDPREERWL